jgi:hypothetical protein
MVGRDEGDQEGRDPHQQEGRDQRRISPDPVAVMAEDRRPDRPRDKADGVDREGLQCPDQRVRLREIELGENQPGDRAVDEEIVPFDRRADRAGDHRAVHWARCSSTERTSIVLPAVVIAISSRACPLGQLLKRSTFTRATRAPPLLFIQHPAAPGDP